MSSRWKIFGFQLHNFLCIAITIQLQIGKCFTLNSEGLALMTFSSKIEYDPYGVLGNWNSNDYDPCRWSGVQCIAGKVDSLNLNGLSLKGVLVPELGNLSQLRSLSLCKNNFSGAIPKELSRLSMLEMLDLRKNNLSGKVPEEISKMPSLQFLFICNNRLEGIAPVQLRKHDIVSQTQLEAHYFQSRFRFWKDSSQLRKAITEAYDIHRKGYLVGFNQRRLLKADNNLPANKISSNLVQDGIDVLSTGSGSFPAMQAERYYPLPENLPSPESLTSPSSNSEINSTTSSLLARIKAKWPYVLVTVAAFAMFTVTTMLILSHSCGMARIGPWNIGLSGQLRKAFVAGVPKLDRAELEFACEDFVNIIQCYSDCTMYKGTSKSGVEIAVISTVVSSSKDWSKHSEMHFKHKLDKLARVNHKNFVNLLGYCEEDEPFTRMMVFEFASSGTLSEHIHSTGLEHLDWSSRMRIIMGIAYCLQYMHHQLKPPVPHTNLRSSSILLTDDCAAKIVEIDFWKQFVPRRRSSSKELANDSELLPCSIRSNVYNFGVILLEIVSGRPAYTRKQGSILNWAVECLNDYKNTNYLVDPSINDFDKEELDVIYKVIQECVHQEPRKRPTMKEVTSRLREVLGISPEAAAPRLSPLWWAELEILSMEAS